MAKNYTTLESNKPLIEHEKAQRNIILSIAARLDFLLVYPFTFHFSQFSIGIYQEIEGREEGFRVKFNNNTITFSMAKNYATLESCKPIIEHEKTQRNIIPLMATRLDFLLVDPSTFHFSQFLIGISQEIIGRGEVLRVKFNNNTTI